MQHTWPLSKFDKITVLKIVFFHRTALLKAYTIVISVLISHEYPSRDPYWMLTDGICSWRRQ